jgi:hypothetical protein
VFFFSPEFGHRKFAWSVKSKHCWALYFCSSDREKLLKFNAEGRKLAKF